MSTSRCPLAVTMLPQFAVIADMAHTVCPLILASQSKHQEFSTVQTFTVGWQFCIATLACNCSVLCHLLRLMSANIIHDLESG